jgi:hypothetical protein
MNNAPQETKRPIQIALVVDCPSQGVALETNLLVYLCSLLCVEIFIVYAQAR